jgi:hypothetical protein
MEQEEPVCCLTLAEQLAFVGDLVKFGTGLDGCCEFAVGNTFRKELVQCKPSLGSQESLAAHSGLTRYPL